MIFGELRNEWEANSQNLDELKYVCAAMDYLTDESNLNLFAERRYVFILKNSVITILTINKIFFFSKKNFMLKK